jgi:hypothetical protein
LGAFLSFNSVVLFRALSPFACVRVVAVCLCCALVCVSTLILTPVFIVINCVRRERLQFVEILPM